MNALFASFVDTLLPSVDGTLLPSVVRISVPPQEHKAAARQTAANRDGLATRPITADADVEMNAGANADVRNLRLEFMIRTSMS